MTILKDALKELFILALQFLLVAVFYMAYKRTLDIPDSLVGFAIVFLSTAFIGKLVAKSRQENKLPEELKNGNKKVPEELKNNQ